jgi:dimethylhistidine N-methyltransferase
LQRLRREHPALEILGVAADFSHGLTLPPTVRAQKRLFLHLGSSIGNFSPPEALALLRDIRAHCGEHGALLIGVDLVKSVSALHAAYNDALGVTAAFNLNLLNHVNRLIGGDFDVGDWRHRAFFNASMSRIEMHLDARRRQVVRWAGGKRSFAAGESIHTENSYKYRIDRFSALLTGAGFGRVRAFSNAHRSFSLFLARP